MSDEEYFPECGPQSTQEALASPQSNTVQEADSQRIYNGKSYTLDEQLERSVTWSSWYVLKKREWLVWDKERDSMASVSNPFYPERDDLAQIVRLKLLPVRQQLEEIWADPDEDCGGVRGISKLVLAVTQNAAIDYYRYRNLRAPEVLATSLDESFAITDSEGNTEDEGVLADLISDEEVHPQAFSFAHLRDTLTDEEYTVLYETTVNGAKQTELAQEMGTSDSAISRTKARAENKAATWLAWLKNSTYKQVKSHITMTYSRRPSLRPNKIAKSSLDNWNKRDRGLEIVPFHDESSAWRPAIKNQPRVKASRECWNDACTKGGAVGPNNLILPSSQATNNGRCGDFRNAEKQSGDFQTMHGVTWEPQYEQPVRFLPAITGRVKQFCDDCAKENRQAEQQAVTPIRDTAHFFENETRSNNATSKENKMDYKQAAELIKAYDIPRATIARLADVHSPTLSSYLNGTLDVTRDKADRINAWTTDVAKMISAMGTLGIKVDLADVDNVRHLVTKINDAERQMNLPLEAPDVLQGLPDVPPLRSSAV